MSTFATVYTYVADSDSRRDEVRPAHRDYLTTLTDQGRLVVSGPWVGAPAAALLVFAGESADDVRALVDADPFVQAGLVADISIREWTIVSGRLASQF
jgi:uncharacterized protein YciI